MKRGTLKALHKFGAWPMFNAFSAMEIPRRRDLG